MTVRKRVRNCFLIERFVIFSFSPSDPQSTRRCFFFDQNRRHCCSDEDSIHHQKREGKCFSAKMDRLLAQSELTNPGTNIFGRLLKRFYGEQVTLFPLHKCLSFSCPSIVSVICSFVLSNFVGGYLCSISCS